jgi:flagellar biogenesis protein FliO
VAEDIEEIKQAMKNTKSKAEFQRLLRHQINYRQQGVKMV